MPTKLTCVAQAFTALVEWLGFDNLKIITWIIYTNMFGLFVETLLQGQALPLATPLRSSSVSSFSSVAKFGLPPHLIG